MFSNDGNLSVHHFGGFQGMSGSYAWPPTLRGHLDDDIIFPSDLLCLCCWTHVSFWAHISLQKTQPTTTWHARSMKINWFQHLNLRVGYPRWERFAPGPVQAVHAAPKLPADHEGPPKRRGRPPKDPNQPKPKRGRPPKIPVPVDDQLPSGQPSAQEVFSERSTAASVAVPPEVPAGVAMDDVQVVEEKPSFPTRSTFAGRTKSGSNDFQSQWDSRREIYYKSVPKSFWKDPQEREYWTLCTEIGDNHEAMKQFLEKIDASNPPAAATPSGNPAAQPKAKAKAKAKVVKKDALKPFGSRGRGRGRGKGGGRGKPICR